MSKNKSFTCVTCGAGFEVAETALAKYPGWTPKFCMRCRDSNKKSTRPLRRSTAGAGKKKSASSRRAPSLSKELNITCAEVLQQFHAGPKNGLFTDGSAAPNPGPGGWGAVYVHDDEVLAQKHGHEGHTTNNRMELMALIQAFSLVPEGQDVDVFTDSQLCVNIVTKWAAGWKRNNWKRKSGPIKNLELVQELYALHEQRPELHFHWIKAHDGSRWNEYADALATAYGRDEV